jgi:hypothetical protein
VFLLGALAAIVRHAILRRPTILDWLWRPAATETHEEPRSSLRAGLGWVALFAGLMTLALWAQVREPYSVPDPIDPLFSVWRLAWVAHQLPRDPLHLFDANIFHPEARTLAYSDAMLLPGVAAAPILWAGLHPLLVHNGLLLASLALSGAAAFALVRSLTGDRAAALVAGIVFALFPTRFAHYSQLEPQFTWWMPLALLTLHRVLTRGRIRDGILMGAVLTAQALSSLYYGLFLTLYLVPIALVSSIAGDRRGLARKAAAVTVGALLTVAIVAPYSRPYSRNASVVGERGRAEVFQSSARPVDYLRSTPFSQIYGAPIRPAAAGEPQLFPGLLPLALGVAGLWPPLTPVRLAYCAGLAGAIEIASGLNGTLYGSLYDHARPFRALREPARAGILVGLTLAILGGFGVMRIRGRLGSPTARRVLGLALAGLAVAELRPSLTLRSVWTEPPSIYTHLPSDRSSVLLELPLGEKDTLYQYFSTFHWHRLVNGYSGFFPPSYIGAARQADALPSAESLEALRRRGVDFIVVHGALFDDRARHDRLVAGLEAASGVRRVAIVRWEGHDTRLFELGGAR